SEQIRDLSRLACSGPGSCLGDEYWVIGQGAHGYDGRSEQGSERQRRLGVVAVNPDPGNIRAAGPPVRRRRNASLFFNYVDRPQPGHVPGAYLAEQVYDVPPGGNELLSRGVPIGPGVPGPVHLMAEAQDDRALVGADGVGV